MGGLEGLVRRAMHSFTRCLAQGMHPASSWYYAIYLTSVLPPVKWGGGTWFHEIRNTLVPFIQPAQMILQGWQWVKNCHV